MGDLELLHTTLVTHASARHIHDTLALGMVEQGAAFFDHRRETYVSGVGSVVMINPGEVHSSRPCISTGCTYRMVYPSLELFQQVTSDMAGSNKQMLPAFTTPIIQDEQLAQLIYRLHCGLEMSACRLESECMLLQILTQLIERYADKRMMLKRVSEERLAVRQVKEYLEAHYVDNVSLEQLAQITNLSPFHLTRVFCHALGLPPHAYLLQVRVLRAKRLLSQGWALAQVALETGFTHQSHLHRHFKRIVGVTPKQYQTMSKNVQD